MLGSAAPSGAQTPASDLGITITTVFERRSPGAPMSWTIRVANGGPDASSGFTVTAAVPAGTTDISTSNLSPTVLCNVVDTTVTCTGDSVAVGSFAQIRIRGDAPVVPLGTTVTATATVVGDDPDPNPANDSASVGTLIAYEGNCRGTALRIHGLSPSGNANQSGFPCLNATASELGVNQRIGPGLPFGLSALVPNLSAHLLTAETAVAPFGASNHASAAIASASISLPGLNISVAGIESEVSVTMGASCDDPATFAHRSTVGSLVVNGTSYVVGDQPVSIPLGLATLHLNHFEGGVATGTQRAVWLQPTSSPYLGEVALGEAYVSRGSCFS